MFQFRMNLMIVVNTSLESDYGDLRRRSLWRSTTSSCDRFCSSCLRFCFFWSLPSWKKKAHHRRHTLFAAAVLPEFGCLLLVSIWNSASQRISSRAVAAVIMSQRVEIFSSVSSVYFVPGSGFRVGDGGRRRRRRRRLQRKDRMYGFARQARRVPSVRTVPGERPARREQNPTSLLRLGEGEQRWCFLIGHSKKSQQLLTTRRHANISGGKSLVAKRERRLQ